MSCPSVIRSYLFLFLVYALCFTNPTLAEPKTSIDCPIPTQSGFHLTPGYTRRLGEAYEYFHDTTNDKIYNLKWGTIGPANNATYYLDLYEYDVYSKCSFANGKHLNLIAQSKENHYDVEVVASFFDQATRTIWALGHADLVKINMNVAPTHPNSIIAYPDFLKNSAMGKEIFSEHVLSFYDGKDAYLLGATEGELPIQNLQFSNRIYKLSFKPTPQLQSLSVKLPTKLHWNEHIGIWNNAKGKFYMFGLTGATGFMSFDFVWSFNPSTLSIEAHPEHPIKIANSEMSQAFAVYNSKNKLIYLFAPDFRDTYPDTYEYSSWVLIYDEDLGFLPTGHHANHVWIKQGSAIYDKIRDIILVTRVNVNFGNALIASRDTFIPYVPEKNPQICQCNSCASCTAKLNSPNCLMVNVTAPLNSTGTCIDNPEDFHHKVFNCQGHAVSAGLGINLEDKLNSTILNCKFNLQSANTGIRVLDSERIRIEKCEFSGPGTAILSKPYSSANNSTELLSITDNSFQSTKFPINLYDTEYTTVTDNKLLNYTTGIQLDGGAVTVYDNYLANGTYGMLVKNGEHIIAQNAILYSDSGIYNSKWYPSGYHLYANMMCYNQDYDMNNSANLTLHGGGNFCDSTLNYSCDYACPNN